MKAILKYPRTPHLVGSRLQPGDEDVKQVSRDSLGDALLTIEEKLDGSNTGIRFDDDGEMVLQSRGHALAGGPRELQFALLKRWAGYHRAALWEILGTRYLMYGEWTYARHTIRYDRLPHYFHEFDIYDRESGEFLDTPGRHAMLAGSPVLSVPVLGRDTAAQLDRYIGPSRYSTTEIAEGLYLKQEKGGRTVGRFKYVRPDFTQAVIDSGEHWMDRPIEPNRLCDGVDLFA